MSEKWLYLPVEVITREIDAKLLLTYYAVKQQFNVILAKQHKLYEQMESLPKGIFLSKGYPKNKKGPLFDAKEFGHAVVELDEEGLIFNENVYLSHRVQEDYFRILDHVYCWGIDQKNTLLRAYGEKEKLSLTGHPRFDLLKEKYRSIYSDEVETIKKQYGNFILVNTRFGVYNHIKGFRPRHEFIKSLYDHFISMVKELSKKYPTYNIIIRPHPREKFESYHTEFKHCKNVFVVHEGSIVKWNLAASCVIHNGCTTGIEAFLLDRPVLSYMPVTSEKHTDEYLANEVSLQVTSLQELMTIVDSYLNKGENIRLNEQNHKNKRKNILSNYYAALDENYAYENILRLLTQLTIKDDSSSEDLNITIEDPLIEDEVEIENDTSLISRNKIEAFFSKLDEIEKCPSNMIIDQLDRNFFIIKNKK